MKTYFPSLVRDQPRSSEAELLIMKIHLLVVLLASGIRIISSECGENVSCQQECSAQWSDWSETCFRDSATDQGWQDRILRINPGTANADACSTGLYVYRTDTKDCTTNLMSVDDWSKTSCDDSSTKHFQCGNFRCIPEGLKCNGDDDCGDASDEYPVNPDCGNSSGYICGIEITTSNNNLPPQSDRFFLGIPGIEKFSPGFDILSGAFRGSVLSMAAYGSCRRVLRPGGDPDYYYRLPGNVDSFRQSLDLAQNLGKIVKGAYDLIQLTQQELMENPLFGGIISGIDGTVGLSQSEKFSKYTLDSIRTFNRYVLVTTTTNIRVFQIKLKNPKLLGLSLNFMQRVADLPDKLSYNKYMSFLMDFGTHYVTSATLGGSYSEATLYDRCWLDEDYEYQYGNGDWEENLVICQNEKFKTKLNAENTLSSICLPNPGVSATYSNLPEAGLSTTFKVVGGGVSEASKLEASFTTENWQSWVDSVATSPSLAMEDFTLESIVTLMDIPSLPLNSSRRVNIKNNLELAITEYLRPYNASYLCASESVRNYCGDYCGDSSKENNISTAYLTGRGGSAYKCQCACQRGPDPFIDQECSSLSVTSSYFITSILSIVIVIRNLQ